MDLPIDLPYDQIAALCRRWKISEFALFGSILREDFRPDSDIDVLVTFQPDSHWSLLDFAGIQGELSDMLDRPVDLVDKLGVERSHNLFRKKAILESAQVVLNVT